MSKEYVNKIRYLTYSTIYSSNKTIKLSLNSRDCFAELLNRRPLSDEHYEVVLVRDTNYAVVTHNSNLCFLTEPELKRHLNLARRLFHFKYSIEEYNYNGHAAFKVNIDMNAPHFYHRYLLTWLRYAYEFPYNVILSDALRLKRECLRKTSITNLFVLCANSYQHGPYPYGSGHAIAIIGSEFLKEGILKAKINKLANEDGLYKRVNDIYRHTREFSYLEGIKDPDGKSYYLEYWEDTDEFKKRAEVYLANYRKMIKR